MMASYGRRMETLRPQCYIPSFVEIGLPVPEKIFFMAFTIYGHGGHLGHKLSFPLPKDVPHEVWL